MIRFRTHIAAAYTLSVVLVALGHCWPAAEAHPMPAAEAQAAPPAHAHAHAAHAAEAPPHGHAAAGTCPGDETACPVALAPPALLPMLAALPEPAAQAALPAAPQRLVAAASRAAVAPRGPPDRQTQSGHAYAEAFARTGRLLI